MLTPLHTMLDNSVWAARETLKYIHHLRISAVLAFWEGLLLTPYMSDNAQRHNKMMWSVEGFGR